MKLKCLGSGSKGNCYSLEDSEKNILLLDVGIPIKDIKIGIDFRVSNVRGALISHEHSDHSYAMKDLKKMGIPIIAPYIEQPKDSCLKGFIVRYFGLTDKDNHFVHSNADGSECPVYGFYISHDKEPLRMLYITDCAFVKYRFAEIDNILLGINYADECLTGDIADGKKMHILNGHMELKTGVEFIKVCDRKKTLNNVIVGHLSDTNADIPLFEKEIRKVTECNIRFAMKGETYQL